MVTLSNRTDRKFTYFIGNSWDAKISLEPLVLTTVDTYDWELLKRLPAFQTHIDKGFIVTAGTNSDPVDTSKALADKGAAYLKESESKGDKKVVEGVSVAPSPANSSTEIKGLLTAKV